MALELVDDLRYSILELNAHAMQRSQVGQLAEAQQLLETAYIRLQSADAAVLAADAGLIDQLKATTLSNLGVVECHKKELDKSLDHLEAALAIEKRIGVFSPTTALNLCATFNALGRYEEAVEICSAAIQSLMATNGGVPTEENKTLWAAAWHNLSVAEMNLGGEQGGTDERRIAVLNMFRNAMRSSVDLLGAKHPLTATIHESYRAARPTLKKQGAYKIRDSFLPMLSTSASAQSQEKRRQLMTQTLTEDEKLGSVPAYEGALAGNTGRTNIDAAASRRVPSLLTAVRKAQRGDAFRPTQTLVRAQPLYLSHHPATIAAPRQSELLLQPRQREMRRQRIPSIAPQTNPRLGGGGSSSQSPNRASSNSPARRKAQTARQQQQQQQSGKRGGSPPGTARSTTNNRNFNPATNKVLSSLASGGAGGGGDSLSWSAANNTAKQRSVEQALVGDMWVEVEVPMARRNSPPHGASRGGGVPALRQPGTGGGGAGGGYYGVSTGSPLAWGGSYGTGEFRAPAYGQNMHVIEPSDPIMERVAQPSAFASIDLPGMLPVYGGGQQQQYQYQPAPQQQQQQSRQVPHPQQHQQQHMMLMSGMGSLAMQPNAASSVTTAPSLPPLPMMDGGNNNQQQQQLIQPLGIVPSQQSQQPQQTQQQPLPQPRVPFVHQPEPQLERRSGTPPSPERVLVDRGGGVQSAGVVTTTTGATSPPIPQPPKRPASSGTRPNPVPPPRGTGSRPQTPKENANQQQQQKQQPGRNEQGFAFLADALGHDIKDYPGLAMLAQM